MVKIIILKKILVATIIYFLLIANITSAYINIKNENNFTKKLKNPLEKKWTFMCYMDGDSSDLDDEIIFFINDAELIGSTDDLNVVMQVDDYRIWNNQTRRYYIQYDSNLDVINSPIVDTDTSEKDMGDITTLVNFVEWTVQNYPAEHYVLSFFSHGGGWTGFCSDSSHGSKIRISDLEIALDQINQIIGKKIDIIYCVACTMGMIEVAYQIKDNANIFIAAGNPLSITHISYSKTLEVLNTIPDDSVEDISKEIIDACYFEFENLKYHRLFGIKLYNITSFMQDLNTLANKGMTLILKGGIEDIDLAYDESMVYNNNPPHPHDIYTIAYSFAYSLGSPNNPDEECINIANNIKNVIIRPTEEGEHTIEEKLNGLSICFPKDKKEFSSSLYYQSLQFSKFSVWDEFLSSYHSKARFKNNLIRLSEILDKLFIIF